MSEGVNCPRVGVGGGDKILFGMRKGSHEPGVWCIPGGHLEYGEEFAECSLREIKEETGLDVSDIRLGIVTNNINAKEDRHYVSIIMVADYVKGEQKLLEPDKCMEWKWFSLDALPSSMCTFNDAVLGAGFDPRKV